MKGCVYSMEIDIRDYYLGLQDEIIDIEKADAEDKLVEWKCKHGHKFMTTVSLAASVIKNELCPCCRERNGLELDVAAVDCTEPYSLYVLDREIFEGELEKKFVSSGNNCFNTTKYNSINGVDWNIGGKLINMSPASMIKRIVEEKQYILREKYEVAKKYENNFEIMKCEACGKYIPHFKWDRISKNEKCPQCNEFIHNPFTFGRWLNERPKIKKRLHELLSKSEFNRIYNLNRNDTDTRIIIPAEIGIINTTAFDITHRNIKF